MQSGANSGSLLEGRSNHWPCRQPTQRLSGKACLTIVGWVQPTAFSGDLVGCTPYAQLKGSWSSMKNGRPLFHHVLQCVSCWKKELPDGDCRQGRRDYTKCPGTRSRGTWAGDRCYPAASKVHRRQLVADARPDSAQKTGCQGHRFPIHRCTVGPRRHFDGRRESLHASTRGVPSCGAGAHCAPGVGRVASNRRLAEQVHERSHRRQQYHRTARRTGRPVPRLWRHLARGWPR